ncbi:MAG: hypothetical protein AB7H71_12365, partial [Alphaproteobacteria bacterium]
VFERTLQQRLLVLELRLSAAKLGDGTLLPPQKEQHQTAEAGRRNAEYEIAQQMGRREEPALSPGDQQQRQDSRRRDGFRACFPQQRPGTPRSSATLAFGPEASGFQFAIAARGGGPSAQSRIGSVLLPVGNDGRVTLIFG